MMNKFFLIILVVILVKPGHTQKRLNNPFKGVEPLSIEGSFKMKDHIVWGGSVVQHDGKYYMFVSIYPDSIGRGSWVANSRVALAIADHPEGPYQFEKIVLPYRDKSFWDGRMTHNPTIHKHNDKYYLFYIGTTYQHKRPIRDITHKDPVRQEAWTNQRIGVAVADHPLGPWKRPDQPVIEPRKGKWDMSITTNPAPVIHDDGSVLLIYKSTNMVYPERMERHSKDGLPRFIMGAAKAGHPLGEYERIGDRDGMITLEGRLSSLEDPFVWYQDGVYHMLIKNFEKDFVSKTGAGIYVWSMNGHEWFLPKDDPLVYTREVSWKEGITTVQRKLERPQVYFENGRPAYIFLGTGFREKYWDVVQNPVKTYNVVFKIKR